MIAEVHRDSRKHPKPFAPADFMPHPPAPAPRPHQAWTEMLAHVVDLNSALGGSDLRTRGER